MDSQSKPSPAPTGRQPQRRHRIWRIAVLFAFLLLATAAWLADWQPRFLVQLFHRDNHAVFYGPGDGGHLAITIDDGPSAATNEILDALRRHDVRATLFLMAAAAQNDSGLVRRIVREGHEIGNHLWEDRPAYKMSREEFRDALARSQRVLTAFAPVRWFRPPHAIYLDWMIADARRDGLTTVIGSLHPYDTAVPSVEYAVSQILRNGRAGDILVLHDGAERGLRSAEILDRVLPGLRERGLQPGRLSDLQW